MLYYVKFSGIKYPMESLFTPGKGEMVLCEMSEELFVGIADDKIYAELKSKGKVLRPIYDKEMGKVEEMKKDEREAYKFCQVKIVEHELPMKLVGVDKEWNGKRYKFYFLANKRVDFRELVKDLKEKYGVIIELRHIGVRDFAGYLGGLGMCGRPLCCNTFLVQKQSIQLEDARDQDIYVNPSKISGPCCRLLCCLAYEHDFYCEASKKFPERGDTVITDKGESSVLHRNMLTEIITVSYEDEVQEEIHLSELKQKGNKWLKIVKKQWMKK